MKSVCIYSAFVGVIASTFAIDLHITAIISKKLSEPTSAGQIGINLVTPIITIITITHAISIDTQATGDPKSNVGKISANTEYLTENGGITKWIGLNTAYLTEVVQTVTINGAVSSVTNTPSIQIIGPVDEDGVPTGAFDFLLTPLLVGQIQDLADTICKDKTACATDFPPRVEAVLENGGYILTERGIETVVEIAGGITIAYLITKYTDMAFHGEPIPHIIHIDVNDYAPPSPTAVIATTFVMNIETMPTTVVEVADEDATNEEDEDQDCWIYVGVDLEPIDADSLDETTDSDSDSNENKALAKRSLAGRILVDNLSDLSVRALEARGKRGVVRINVIGQCGTKPIQDEIPRAEIHPGPGQAMQPFNLQSSGVENGLDPRMYWYVPRQAAKDTNDPCFIARLTQKGKRNPVDPDITQTNFPLPYDQSSQEKTLGVDHIFETSTLQDFFNSIFSDPADPRCATFVPMFSKSNTGPSGPASRFHTLWSQQSNPSPGNWAFAGVDARINNLKGVLLNPALESFPNFKNIEGPNANKHFDRLFQTWNNVGLSMDFLNDPKVADYFSQRNGKVYSAFRDFDEVQRCEKDPKDTTPSTAWAEEFKKYMINLLATNQVLLQAKIIDISARIAAERDRLKDPRTNLPNKYGRAFLNLRTTYPPTYFVYDTSALLKFPEESVGIRDERSANDCPNYSAPRQASSVVSSSPTPTPSALCVVRTLVDCIYQYEDRPDISIADCPPIPPLPASCGGGGPAATSAPSPSPTPVPQPPVLGPQGCYASESHEDVHGNVVNDDAGKICSEIWKTGEHATMDANTVAKTYNPNSWFLSSNNYWYGVGWIVGCQTTATTQLVGDPLADGNNDHACPKLLSNNWGNCNNGGTGGWIDAGCLRYTFKASENKLTDNWDGVVKIS